MATSTNWRYFNDVYFRDNNNLTNTFYSVSWETNTWSIYSTNTLAWRVVASNNSGAWTWNSNGNFIAQAGLTNNELGTLSHAVRSSVSNRMPKNAIAMMTSEDWRKPGGFVSGQSPRTGVTFLSGNTNASPRVYSRTALIDDLRYQQKGQTTNDYEVYFASTNPSPTLIKKKLQKTCDAVIVYQE
jgi:hypothetical protein